MEGQGQRIEINKRHVFRKPRTTPSRFSERAPLTTLQNTPDSVSTRDYMETAHTRIVDLQISRNSTGCWQENSLTALLFNVIWIFGIDLWGSVSTSKSKFSRSSIQIPADHPKVTWFVPNSQITRTIKVEFVNSEIDYLSGKYSKRTGDTRIRFWSCYRRRQAPPPSEADGISVFYRKIPTM